MPNPTIEEAVAKEMANQNPTNQEKPEPLVEENQPNKPADKPEPKKTEDIPAKEDPKHETADEKDQVELDKKLKVVSYDRFKEVNERNKQLQAEKDAFLKNKKDPEFADEDDKEAYDKFKKL